MIRFVKALTAIPVALSYLLAISPLPTQARYNYGEALQKSILFYEAQQAGKLPEWNRVPWRGDSVLNDGKDVGVDLSGGWFDAGDNVKFGLPMAATVTMLAWGGIEYYEAFEKSNQLIDLERNLQWATDYFLQAFANDNAHEYIFYGQVGDGELDHSWWGSAEVVNYEMARPVYKIDTNCPGTDLAGETAAALASTSILLRRMGNNNQADLLLSKGEKLYDFADHYRGNYSDCIPAAPFYKTHNGYQDELVWGAIWLHKAKKAQNSGYSGKYLTKAISEYQNMAKPYNYTIGYDDKSYGVYVLLAQETGDVEYQERAEAWLDFWTIGYQGERVRYTPGGLAFLSKWGSLVGSSVTSFVSFIYSDWLREQGMKEKADRYFDFSVGQIRYLLGDNPDRRSYIIGFGHNYPRNPHHRTAHGSWDNGKSPSQNRNLIIGALVGGPDERDRWNDNRDDYVRNEVALTYNSGLVGALARMYLQFGGYPLEEITFPQTSEQQVYLDSKIQQKTGNLVKIRTLIVNKSFSPAMALDNAQLRLFFNVDAESIKSLQVSVVPSQCNGISQPVPVKENLYYIEVSCQNTVIYPGGEDKYQKQVEIQIINRDSNSQIKEILSQPLENIAIALYNHGQLIYGNDQSNSR